VLEVGERLDGGRRRVHLRDADTAVLDDVGAVPLPPYITTPLADPGRYQTVYADRPGSVAAPTAGLHLTDDVLRRCRAAGAVIAEVDLAVGLGTFRPVKSARAEDHEMHAERYRVPDSTVDACRSARRVVAVGTTTVRALETAAATGRTEGRSDLFVHGDFPWRVVDVLLTNFHQPRSTLLLMLEAFCGPRWRDLYATALGAGYRFLSFGDAMIVTGGRRRTATPGGEAP
jgi:S-adenosylmethionine:tRNA ribosyltransferase-isomerase